MARSLAESLDLPLKVGAFLAGRGFVDHSAVRKFRDTAMKDLPGPETMPGMDQAVELLLEARRQGALVAVSGDYDADGLTASALLKRVLEPLGFSVVVRIPNRLTEGYGLSVAAVKELFDKGAKYLVTVDSGVSDSEAVMEALNLGLKVIITDHHQLPPTLPKAAAIVNPHLGGGWEKAPLAGVGVAFMLAWAVRRACPDVDRQAVNLVEHLSLVALGTIADLAPLVGPNRTMVHHGLNFLLASAWPGLAAMRKILKLDGQSRLSVRDVGFKLAPRLNAAGRLGSADPALEILLTDDPAQADVLARELEAINRKRFEAQAELVEEALELLEHDCPTHYRTIVLAKEGWPRGLLGLGASKVAERTGRPTLIFSIDGDLAVGSGRTAGNFDLYEALSLVRSYCRSMGGHSQAAGLRVSLEKLEIFKEAFEKAAQEQSWSMAESELAIDVSATIPELSALASGFATMEPFGQGNPPPVIVLFGLKVLAASTGKAGRVELRLSDGFNRFNISGFNLSSRYEEIGPIMDVVLTFEPENNSYGNIWRLTDFRQPASDSNPRF